MRKFTLFLICMVCMQVAAQEEKLRLTFNWGEPVSLNVADIKEISFFEEQNPLYIVGEWFNYSPEENAFESFNFYEDGSLDFYYYYINNNIGGEVYGLYELRDGVLAVNLLGQEMYNLLVAHTETSFVVRSAGSNTTYYKVVDVYDMTTADSPIKICDAADSILFVDNIVVGLEDGKIKALQKGTGYVLVKDVENGSIVAYRINVKYQAGELIDWTGYFKKTKEEILAEFGTHDDEYSSADGEYIVYNKGYNAEISMLGFSFDNETGKVYQVQTVFRGYEEMKMYYDYIDAKYILDEDSSETTEFYFYDTDDINTASLLIYLKAETPMQIIYTDLSDE